MGPKNKNNCAEHEEKNECKMSLEDLEELNPEVLTTVQEICGDTSHTKPHSFSDFYCYNNPECSDCYLIDKDVEAVEIFNELYNKVDDADLLNYLFEPAEEKQ